MLGLDLSRIAVPYYAEHRSALSEYARLEYPGEDPRWIAAQARAALLPRGPPLRSRIGRLWARLRLTRGRPTNA